MLQEVSKKPKTSSCATHPIVDIKVHAQISSKVCKEDTLALKEEHEDKI